MKQIFLMVIAILGMTSFANAQQSRGGMRMDPEQRAKRSVDMLSRELTLTQVQKDSIYAFSLDEAKKQQELFQQGDANNRRDNFEKMKGIRQESQGKIKSVLTDDQQKVYDKLLQERQNRMKEKRGGRN